MPGTPKFGLDLSMAFDTWDAVAEAVSEEFANTYLAKARMLDGVLRPRTSIAFRRLTQSPEAMKALEGRGLTISGPYLADVPHNHPWWREVMGSNPPWPTKIPAKA